RIHRRRLRGPARAADPVHGGSLGVDLRNRRRRIAGVRRGLAGHAFRGEPAAGPHAAERLMISLRPPRHRSMVGWYDPRVLMHSAYQIAIANIFGRHSDTRLIEALASQPQAEFDYSQEQGDFWFDYVSDVGDGWNSTYAVADAIAQPTLDVTHGDTRETLRAGRVLVFGGDEVYPYPSRNEYEIRTEGPYSHA